MGVIEKFWIRALLYGVVVVAVPVLWAAHFLDSFIQTAWDVVELYRFATDKIKKVEERAAKD